MVYFFNIKLSFIMCAKSTNALRDSSVDIFATIGPYL